MAIILAGHHPAVELLGISTVAGNQTAEKVTENALRVLHATGLSHIGKGHGMQPCGMCDGMGCTASSTSCLPPPSGLRLSRAWHISGCSHGRTLACPHLLCRRGDGAAQASPASICEGRRPCPTVVPPLPPLHSSAAARHCWCLPVSPRPCNSGRSLSVWWPLTAASPVRRAHTPIQLLALPAW